MDASVSFERCWNEYVDGFGDVYGNFWLGLEAMHDLTTAQPMSLQIDIVLFYLPAVSIPYQQIHVGDAASDYLLTISSGTPGDGNLYNSFVFNSGSKFTTYDHDEEGINCASQYRSGWWFSSCFRVCLNGVYGGASGIVSHSMRMITLGNNNHEPIINAAIKIKAIN